MAKQNNELLQRIKTLEDIEQKEYDYMGAALKNVQENVKSLTQCINQVKDFQHHHQLGMSPDLVQAEGMITSILQRIQEIADFHQSQHTKTSSALQQASESLKSLWESSSFQNSAEATEERNTSQSTGRNHQQNQKQWKIFSFFTQFFSQQKTATNTETQEQKLKEKDEELQATRSALNKTEEELKSFKDRVALEVAPSIKTGNTMSLNSPVSKNRIREMYETLRRDWPKIKEDLKLAGEKPDSVQKMIQKQFTSSRTDMEEKKNVMISDNDELNKSKHGTESPEVKEYLLLAIQNLQLAIYNHKYDNDSQKPLSAHEVTNPKYMMEYLSSECYWLGCLMALSNPPINPDWENHPASMDKWDILPRNITAASVKK